MTDIPGPSTEPSPGPADAAPPATFASRMAPTLPEDWPAKAADTVDLVVATISDRAVRPVVVGARALVFGVLIFLMVLVSVTWISIAFVRLLDVYLWPGKVWASYFLLAVIFCTLGFVAWSQRYGGADDGTGT